jgi:ferritin
LRRLALQPHVRAQYSLMFAFHAMRSFCNKDRVALKGLAHYFQREMHRAAACALMWSDYQTKRGGNTALFPIEQPEHNFQHEHGDAQRVMEMKLSLERLKYNKLDRMHKARCKLRREHACLRPSPDAA